MDELSRINSPDVYPPIDLVPLLKYLPAKLALWHAPARAVERVRRQTNKELYENVLKKMQKDHTEPEWKCWTEWAMFRQCLSLSLPERAQMLKDNFLAATGELQKYEVDLAERGNKQRMRELRARLS
ncbi:hypothetical protein CPB85DRAFT_1255895 [Mucidula mucida]|nr:hypothetical protein CPB85DRAFT_1255895 [Mucidula mucida]